MGVSNSVINISIFEFSRRLCNSGGISIKGFFLLLAYYLQIILSLPFALFRFLFYRNNINKTRITKDPVFILGHYRCGTSLLQKLLACDKNFGFLNYYDALFPNTGLIFGRPMQFVLQQIINLLRLKNPFFHDTVLQLSEPDEEDDYLINRGSVYSAYWGFIFPQRWKEWLNGSGQFADEKYKEKWKEEYLSAIKFITFRNNNKQLILKNPPNTERISFLLEMFPDARFIFIYRNPYLLFFSVRNMWKTAILPYYSVQNISDMYLDEIVFSHFEYIMEQYEKDKHLIPFGNLTEISYEELIKDPLRTIKKIYSDISLPGFEKTEKTLLSQIESEKKYRTFNHDIKPHTLEIIGKRWKKYIMKWNYSMPVINSSMLSKNI